MKKSLSLIYIILLSANSFAQQVHPQWTKTGGSTFTNRGEEGKTIAVDNDGNIYVAGTFSGKTSFGGIVLKSAEVKIDTGSYKLKPFGIHTNWAQFETGGHPEFFTDAVKYPKGEVDSSDNDLFLVKYNSSHVAQWAVRMGGLNDESIYGDIQEWVGEIKVSSNAVYIVGTFFGTMNFSSPYEAGVNEVSSYGAKDIFLAKFNTTDGSFQWVKRAGGGGNDIALGMAINDNSIYTCGSFTGSANFNSPINPASNNITSFNASTSDGFFAKYDIDGNIQYAKRIGGYENDAAQKIAVAGSSVYICGYFKGTANFNNPSSSGTNELIANYPEIEDHFLAKFNDVGILQWTKRAGTTYSKSNGYEIVYSDKNIYMEVVSNTDESLIYLASPFIAESSQNTANNFNTPSSNSSNTVSGNGIFIAKFNDSGNFIWSNIAESIGGTFSMKCNGLGNINNNLYILGEFNNYYHEIHFFYSNGSIFTLPDATLNRNFQSPYYNTYLDHLTPFIAQFNNAGAFVSASQIIDNANLNTSDPEDISYDNNLAVDFRPYERHYLIKGNDMYMTGGFGGTTVFSSNKTDGSNQIHSNGGNDFYLAKSQINDGTVNGSSYNPSSFQWAISEGHADQNFSTGLESVTDSYGNIYVAGIFTGEMTFGSFKLKSAGERDVYLVKYNSSGVVQWARRCGGNSDEGVGWFGGGVYLAITASNIYISSIVDRYGKNINFNTPSSFLTNSYKNKSIFTDTPVEERRLQPIQANSFSFVAQYTTNGDFIWANLYAGNITDITAYGTSVYFTATISRGIDLGPAFTRQEYNGYGYVYESMGQGDIVVVKLNNAGSTQWVRRMGDDDGGYQNDKSGKIVADFSGIYVTGTFANGFGYGDPHSALFTGSGSFLALINSSGNLVWAKRTPSGFQENITRNHLAINSNSIFIAARFNGTINFNSPSAPGTNELSTDNPSNTTNYDHFVAKYTKSNGVFQWAKRTDATIMSLVANESALYISGQFENTANFNTPFSTGGNQLISSGGKDIFIGKYDFSGNVSWLKKAGSNGSLSDEFGRGLSLYETNIYMTGKLSGYLGQTKNVDFSYGGDANTITTYGSADVFLTRLFEGSITTNALSGSSFCAGTTISVPFTGSGYFETGYKVQISNASGIFPNKSGFIGSSTTEDPILATLPLNAVGTNYKVRVISTNPEVEGSSTPLLGFNIIAASKGGTATGGTTVCTGTNSTTLTLTGKVGNVLKWQQAGHPSFSSFVVDINSTSNSIVVANQTGTSFFRALVQNGSCASDYSISTPIVVSPATVAGSLSSVNGIFCSGTNDNTINLTGKTGSVLKWQSSSNSTFTSPIDIANTTTSLNVENISSSTFYRAIVKSGACAEANTSGRQIAISSGPTTLPSSFPLNNITYPVKSNFTITGQNLVSGNSNVLYRSKKAIELKPGFRAENGTIFKAEIGICN